MTAAYLGMTRRTAAAVAAVALVIGAAIGLTVPTLQPAPCGYVLEGAEVVPAACSTVAELDARVAAIRAERSGGRW